MRLPAALFLALSCTAAFPAQPQVQMPPELMAALKQHVGSWHTEATVTANGASFRATADWECQAAVGGPGLLCTWLHTWPGGVTDRAVEVVGFDPQTRKLSFLRVTDKGISSNAIIEVDGNRLIRNWTDTQDGKPLVGFNEVVMQADGYWTQHSTIDVGGVRVMEMRLTHRRTGR